MNLTINEQLMLDTEDANICIFMNYVAGWIRTNATRVDQPLEKRNYREGKFWTYNSLKNLAAYFGFWSIQNIRTIIKKCVDKGLIIIGNFNKKEYDKTAWYTLTDKGLEYYPHVRDKILDDRVDSNLGSSDINTPIPQVPYPLSSKDIISSIEVIDAYHEELPDCPKIKVIDDVLDSRIKNMQKRWSKYSESKSSFTLESFREYLNLLKTKYPWRIKPYLSDANNLIKPGFRNFISDTHIAKALNGEWS